MGAIDGFLVAINSKIGGAAGTDVLDGYKKKLSSIVDISEREILMEENHCAEYSTTSGLLDYYKDSIRNL